MKKNILKVSTISLGLALLAVGTTALADNNRGSIVTASNGAAGNELLMYDKDLNLQATVPTGGLGTGSGLGNQGGIAVVGDTLLVVNAGDNTISSFEIDNGNLTFKGSVSSHGVRPVSIALRKNLAYVVNAGDNTIAGFKVNRNGTLSFLPGSVKTLAGTAPSQIGFGLGGKALIVTEKGTNTIEVFPLNNYNLPLSSVVTLSNGETPFGFEVHGNDLVVSEAFGGTASAVSTYRMHRNGTLTLISPSVDAPGQKAACWIAISNNGKFAYTTNTATNSVSSYRLRGDGMLELSEAVAASTAGGPIDMAISKNKLFVLTSAGIESFMADNHGALSSTGDNVSSPGANGLVMVRDN